MKIKFNSLLIITGFILAMYSASISAQKTSTPPLTTVESVVVDENGKPLAGAIVRGNEGAVFTRTDNMGRFTISVSPQSELFIESEGYEPVVLKPFEYTDEAQLQLKAAPLLEGQRDDVNIAFDRIKQKHSVNAISFISPEEIQEYDNIKSLGEALSGRVLGMYGGGNVRGIGGPLYVVDGLPRSIDNVDITEIEQITVLKDINSAILYGTQARNGVVLITTKRGKAFKRDMKVTGYYGANTPLALPKYLSSAEYMELYNEAWMNDGNPTPRYSEAEIENYRTGNPYRYPNVDYFSSDYIKEFKPFWKTMLELSGGNEKSRYYVNAGWEHSGSYLNFGEGKNANQNAFNVRGNVDMRLNSWITTSLDASAFFYNTREPRGSFWSDAHNTHPHTNAPLLPISMMDQEYQIVKEMLESRKNDVNGLYLLGGSSSYLTNGIASAYSAGYTERFQRTFSFNNRMNFDLKRVLEGLSFHTNINFDFYTIYDQAILNEYAVYQAVWAENEEKIVGLEKFGKDAKPGVHYAGNSFYNRRLGIYGMFDYNRTFNEDHEVKASLLGYTSSYNTIGNYQGDNDYTGGLRVNYAYQKKYLIDFSSAYVISSKLAAGHRGGFSPSLGLAWLISEEDFMQSATAVDYLKLRLSAGILNSDIGLGSFFMHTDRYGASGAYNWYDTYSRNSTVAVQGGNIKLGYEKYKDLNIGLDGQFFNRHLLAEGNIFFKSNYDLLARPQTTYPSFYAPFIPYENFGENTYKGFELGLRYKESLGDFRFEIGGNLLYSVSKIKKRDEIYEDAYRYRAGTSLEGRWGLVADGFFMDQADIDNHVPQGFGAVKPGDIKYVDQNNDGVIDAKDEVLIGRWQAPWFFGLNLKLSYAGFTLFVHGTGAIGADGYLSGNYYWPDGTKKYSEYARNRWTEETKHTATLPRLTTLTSNNNYRSSTFWLYKDNYFNINRAQLSYTLPTCWVDHLKMQKIDLFVDGSGLVTISKYRDIRNINTGGEPNSWNFSAGVKATF